MDKPIINPGEFISTDKSPTPQHNHANIRGHKRISLRQDEQQDIRFACDGVTLPLYEDYGWTKTKIGIANIKNIGLGGVGIISRCNLKPEQEVYLSLDGEYYSIKVMRIQNITYQLHFIGAMWTQGDKKQYSLIIDKIIKLSRSK
ncbi:MAG: hypothetical protein ACI8SJ_000057 [Shewanella sp.]|jgi:hypothetical protein